MEKSKKNGGKSGNRLFDQNAGIADPAQLLPGAVQEFFFCSRYFMQNEDGYSAVVCCPDAPVAELGDSRAAQWSTKLPYRPANSHFSGLLGNNLTNTDSPSWFQLRDSFSYSVFLARKPQGPEDAQECWETATALYARMSYESEETSAALGRERRAHTGDDGCIYSEELSDGRLDRQR